mmetsp:Transcript_52584/g.114837  ORF Transcript_52584/g.114837 Transcript_52584/m.114837 type:complete len:93 (+) Transcript_52584:91-369(+)
MFKLKPVSKQRRSSDTDDVPSHPCVRLGCHLNSGKISFFTRIIEGSEASGLFILSVLVNPFVGGAELYPRFVEVRGPLTVWPCQVRPPARAP